MGKNKSDAKRKREEEAGVPAVASLFGGSKDAGLDSLFSSSVSGRSLECLTAGVVCVGGSVDSDPGVE